MNLVHTDENEYAYADFASLFMGKICPRSDSGISMRTVIWTKICVERGGKSRVKDTLKKRLRGSA